MAKSDKLLDLIHTLSMSEKRYFKVFAQRHVTDGGTQYEKLFELACELDTGDFHIFERAVDAAGISTAYLAADKNYLYQLLMRALGNFHSGRNISMQVKEWLHQIEILFDKGLYDQCLTLTKKARQQAEKHDLYALLMEISLWERKVLGESDDVSAIKNSHSQVLNHLGLMDNMHAFMLLYYQLLELEQELESEPEEVRFERLQKFIQHPFLSSESVPLSFHARRHYWMIYALHDRLLKDKAKELVATERLILIMDSSAPYREESPYDYVEVYNRLLNLKLYGGSPDFEEWLNFYREFPTKLKKAPRNVEARVAIDTHLFEIPWFIQQGKLDEAKGAIGDLKKDMSIYRRQVTTVQSLEGIFWEAAYFQACRRYSDCIHALTPLMNEYPDDEHPDLQLFGRILAMMAHYLRENYTVLPYLADSSLRLVSKHKQRFGMEAWVIRQLRRLGKVEFRGESYAKRIFKGIIQDWEGKEIENPGSRLQEYLDIRSWISGLM
ncbi:MAG: hypothetical protein NWR72_01600 [Bacteroidia bacterium]|nr:hypothetical protein [Bacteroidia bacterium]